VLDLLWSADKLPQFRLFISHNFLFGLIHELLDREFTALASHLLLYFLLYIRIYSSVPLFTQFIKYFNRFIFEHYLLFFSYDCLWRHKNVHISLYESLFMPINRFFVLLSHFIFKDMLAMLHHWFGFMKYFNMMGGALLILMRLY